MTIKQIKNFSYRPHDLIYDPLFVVSGPRDHFKAEIIAKLSQAKYQVCPIFPTMFSDLPGYPSKQIVMRKSIPLPSYKEQKSKSDNYFRQIHSKPHPVSGSERPKYFSIPAITYPSEIIPHLHFPTFTLKKKMFGKWQQANQTEGVSNANIQTDFRESEMQTSPWQPPIKLMENDGSLTPQLLKLDFLNWGSGLPAGKNEVLLIQRARMKRAWEKYLPAPTDEATLEKSRNVIEAIERDEWAFREKEIDEIQQLRMKLLEKMLEELHEKANYRNQEKLRNITEIKKRETDAKITKLRKKTERELRKLELKHRGVSLKYRPSDLVEDFARHKSELYAPLMRHGEHPMRWHQVLDEKLKYYKAQFIGVEEFSTLPTWLNKATVMKDDYNTTKRSGTQICMRETRWTTKVLKKLHEELKNLNKDVTKKSTLRVRIDRSVSEASTPETAEIPDDEEEKYEAVVKIQSVLKGRASQMLIYEGRDKCRELIKELKYSTGVLNEQRESIGEQRKVIKHQQREDAIQNDKLAKLTRALNKLEGNVVGSLLDFLNKELRRLLDERKAHAICFLNERERNDREAAEAGRRQKELRRRREHDEIFKQMVKVRQDTVDLYLQDIVTEGMNFASNDEAEFYIKKLTQKIEEDNAKELEESINVTDQEEMIADLVHHFVLPEVQKEMVRDRIKKRQHEKLVRIHNTLFDDIFEHVPESNLSESTSGHNGSELPPADFQFDFQTERELIENLWNDNQSGVSGQVSTVSGRSYRDSKELNRKELLEAADEVIEVGKITALLSSAPQQSEIDEDVHQVLEELVQKSVENIENTGFKRKIKSSIENVTTFEHSEDSED